MTRSKEMQEVLSRWEETGLSLRAFAQREGISLSKLSYWRRKLREVEVRQEAAGSTGETPRWLPVRVIPHSTCHNGGGQAFEVRLGNGLGVSVPVGFDEAELRRLILALAAC